MGRLLVLFAIADLAILVVALIDCLSVPAEAAGEIRALPRVLWVLLIIVFTPIGGIAWFVAGRPVAVPAEANHGHPAGTARRVSGSSGHAGAPDDDPDFLRTLGGGSSPQVTHEDTELLRQWEADLRRREEELRRRDGRPDDSDPPPGKR